MQWAEHDVGMSLFGLGSPNIRNKHFYRECIQCREYAALIWILGFRVSIGFVREIDAFLDSL